MGFTVYRPVFGRRTLLTSFEPSRVKIFDRLLHARPHLGTDLLNAHRGLSRKLAGSGYAVELRRLR
jgi:hypothetical protein